ncbi:MAG TPA: hypothetical protein VIJ12_02515 [Candidatus Baltobacteraceae bacterium]
MMRLGRSFVALIALELVAATTFGPRLARFETDLYRATVACSHGNCDVGVADAWRGSAK